MNGRTGTLIERPVKPHRPKLRRKGFHPTKPGDLVQVDALYLFNDGVKRYIISAVDVPTRFAFAWCYPSLASLSAKDFLLKFLSVAPFQVRRVQTDNGSEFEDHFHRLLDQRKIIHFSNYPHHPQSNAHVERFQGTLRRQYLDWSESDPTDTRLFNLGLVRWLLWYNTEKPHRSLDGLPPLRYYLNNFLATPSHSHMSWTLTTG